MLQITLLAGPPPRGGRGALADSVSDLKRLLERAHAVRWGIAGRMRDRDGLSVGWELVRDDGSSGGGEGEVALSYHLFLSDYGIRHGDLLHAVVRRSGK